MCYQVFVITLFAVHREQKKTILQCTDLPKSNYDLNSYILCRCRTSVVNSSSGRLMLGQGLTRRAPQEYLYVSILIEDIF
jgi:hypothetical protein